MSTSSPISLSQRAMVSPFVGHSRKGGNEDNLRRISPQPGFSMPVTLSALNIYPVKGLKGIALTESRCTDRGLEHDRHWMVVDEHGVFLTQRDHPHMATVWTDIAGDSLLLSAPEASEVAVPLDPGLAPPLRVRVWNSECAALAVSSAADQWLSDYLGLRARLVYMPDESK